MIQGEASSRLNADVYRPPWETAAPAPTPENLASLFAPKEPEGPTEDAKEEPVKEEAAGEEEPEGDAKESPEGESDEDKAEGEEEEPAEPTVEIDGEKVTLSELKKDRLRQADYTRKTQALAEQRRAVESENQRIRADREQYKTRLDALEAYLAESLPKEPDWGKLLAENPNQYAVEHAKHSQIKERRQAVYAERMRIAQQEADEQARSQSEYVAREHEALLEAIPEWKDEVKASTGKKELVAYAHDVGFTDEQLAGVTDHRVMLILRKAMQFDRLEKEGTKLRAKAEPAKVLKPGTVTQPGGKKAKTQALKAAKDRLEKTGSVEDAARFFELLGS